MTCVNSVHVAGCSVVVRTVYSWHGLLLQIGPRLELELVKIQEGLASGTVLYHRYEERSADQAVAQQDAVEEAQRLRAERRRQQEENVQRKAMEQRREALAQQVGWLAPVSCDSAIQLHA